MADDNTTQPLTSEEKAAKTFRLAETLRLLAVSKRRMPTDLRGQRRVIAAVKALGVSEDRFAEIEGEVYRNAKQGPSDEDGF